MILFVLTITFNIFSIAAQKPERLSRRPARTALADSAKNIAHPGATILPGSNPLAAPATALPDSILLQDSVRTPARVIGESFQVDGDSLIFTPVDSAEVVDKAYQDLFDAATLTDTTETGKKVFIPDPTRAVWLSALCPGLGQIYNRRYWKLPIVIGGYMGLGYGASWNNSMLRDYTRGYNDLMDNDPSTKSYMDFFPPNTVEESLNRDWLERTLKHRKDYFRRNRDLCIIAMVGVYLVAVVDAYVDASLTNFDISPDLSMQFHPALMQTLGSPWPAVGVQWAVNF